MWYNNFLVCLVLQHKWVCSGNAWKVWNMRKLLPPLYSVYDLCKPCNRGKVLCCNRILCNIYSSTLPHIFEYCTVLYTSAACWSGPLRLWPWGAKPASHPSPANFDPTTQPDLWGPFLCVSNSLLISNFLPHFTFLSELCNFWWKCVFWLQIILGYGKTWSLGANMIGGETKF